MNDSTVEVTFKVAKGRTVQFAGQTVADGDKRKVTPAQRDRLAARGLIVGGKASK